MPTNPGFELENSCIEETLNEKKDSATWTVPHLQIPQQEDSNSRDGGWVWHFKQQCGVTDNALVNFCGNVILVGLIWVVLYIFFRDEVTYNGSLFKMLVLVLVAHVVGKLVSIIHLPPLLGMLLTGIAFRSSGYYHVSGVYTHIAITLREVALCVILIRAGLGLDAKALLKLSLVVFRLALLPCLGETFAVATASHLIFGYPWTWGILLGFLMSAVSPAVVVPSLLSLKERGYGQDKGIPTLVIGASSLDDIMAISAFGVFLGIIFSQGDLTQQILQGPKEVVVGLVAGLGFGLLASFFPNRNDGFVIFKRSVMIGIWGLLAMNGSEMIGFAGAGPLSCITASLAAGIFWKLQGWDEHNPVSDVFSVMWSIMQPILFGIIGAEVDLTQLRMDILGYGLLIVICGLTCRIIACFIAVTSSGLNFKEKIFVNLAWIPKATVQAALAPKALDIVQSSISPNPDDLERSSQVLTIAVLSILVTAPLGAIGVALTGPKLLTRKGEQDDETAKIEEP